MEPITTTWLISTMISGWLGNRADSLLCQSTNTLYNRITSRINEPVNHHIQRAVRKSYLQATHMAIVYLLKKQGTLSHSDKKRTKQLSTLKTYLANELKKTASMDGELPDTSLDAEYRELLFPKDVSSGARKAELISQLIASIIDKIEGDGHSVPVQLRSILQNGWTDQGTAYDFYGLIAAFFTQEFKDKDNQELSTIIQTEYLDHISSSVDGLVVRIEDLQGQINAFFEVYQDVLPKLDEILDTLDRIENRLDELPGEVQQMVSKAIQGGGFTGNLPKFSVNSRYQRLLRELNMLEQDQEDVRQDISDYKDEWKDATVEKKPRKKRLLNKAETELLEITEKRNQAQQELQEFITNVLNLAKQLGHEQETTSPRLEKARILFEEGAFEDVDKILNEADIYADIKQHEERAQELANELRVKAKAVVVNKQEDWFERAKKYYAEAARIWASYDSYFDYAYFLADHRQVLQAAIWYEKALHFAADNPQRATMLNNLGNLQRAKNEFDQAETSYLEALEIYRKLAEVNPQTYLPYVATTLNNLGLLQSAKNEFDQAETSYLEALEIRRKLAEVNPQTYEIPLATTHISLSLFYRYNVVDEQKSRSHAEIALALYQKYWNWVPFAKKWGQRAQDILDYWAGKD